MRNNFDNVAIGAEKWGATPNLLITFDIAKNKRMTILYNPNTTLPKVLPTHLLVTNFAIQTTTVGRCLRAYQQVVPSAHAPGEAMDYALYPTNSSLSQIQLWTKLAMVPRHPY